MTSDLRDIEQFYYFRYKKMEIIFGRSTDMCVFIKCPNCCI
jgi:hypothetical protein